MVSPPQWSSGAARAHAVVVSVLAPAEVLIAAQRLAANCNRDCRGVRIQIIWICASYSQALIDRGWSSAWSSIFGQRQAGTPVGSIGPWADGQLAKRVVRGCQRRS